MDRGLFACPFKLSAEKVMTVPSFYQAILETLQGRSEGLRDIPTERLDWAGAGSLLDLYRKTSGKDREALIGAIGRVILDHPAPPAVIAQLIQIASGLDLAQVAPQVRKLQEKPFASQEPLRSAITNYLAFRNLNTSPEALARFPSRRMASRKFARKQKPLLPLLASAKRSFGRSMMNDGTSRLK